MKDQAGSSASGAGMVGPRRASLSLRLHLLLLSLAILIPALLAGAGTAWQLGSAYRHAAENGLNGTARALAAAVEQQIATATTAATTLGGSLEQALRENADLAGVYAQARAVGEAFGGWAVLSRADGTQLFNTLVPMGSPLPLARGYPWITRALETGQPVVSDRLFTGGLRQRPILAVFAPVQMPAQMPAQAAGQEAEPSGTVLILAFEPDRLASSMSRIQRGKIAGLIEVRSGRIVARSVAHAASVGRPAPRWVADALATRESGFAQGASLEGDGIVAAFQRLEMLPWAVVVTAPLQDYNAAWQDPLIRLAIGAALLLAATLLLVGWRAGRLLAPLAALTREAEAVAAGQTLPSLSGPGAITEFETLRHAMAQAAAATQDRALAEGRAAAALEMMDALRAERDRAQLYFDAAGTMLLVLAPDGRVQGINRRGLEILGLPDEAGVLGQDWFTAFVAPRGQAQARAACRALTEGAAAAAQPEMIPLLRADGEERLVAWRGTALRDAAGNVLALLASGEDITERRASEERQTLLMREVDHRAKNALAVVQSIIRLTRADHPADFADAVEGRISALARAYTLLARERWAGSDLRELAEAELEAYAAGARVQLSGPPVRLAPEVVQPMSMVFYELASNAARHGALSVPEGRVALRWEQAPDGALRLEWRERGGPPLPGGPPLRRGFGSRLIRAAVAGQLGGGIDFDWQRDGLTCVLTVAADRVAIRQARIAPPPVPALPSGEPAPGEEAGFPPLRGRHVLLAEDETVVALELADTLRALGCSLAGPAASLAEALRLAEQEPLDLAVLDVNLGGQAAFPVADLLVRRGVPVLFVTGYGEMPGGWVAGGGQGRTALLRKPLAAGALGGALRRLLHRAAPPPADQTARDGTAPPPKARRGHG